MSLPLDLGLFFRNSKTKLGLSLSARAIIYTLAFRVGTKASTWVTPDALAQECGIHRQNIFKPLSEIVATGLVIKKDNAKDKKKKVYSFTDLIKNYHQMSDSSKKRVHEALKDEFIVPVDKSKVQSGKPDRKSRVQSGKPDYVQSGKPDSTLDEKNVESPATYGLQENENSPKVKACNNIKAFNKREVKSQKANDIKPIKKEKNEKKHDFAESMNQMASEKRQIEEHEQRKEEEKRSAMPDYVREQINKVLRR